MRKEKVYLTKAGVEIGLFVLSFSYNAIKYDNIIDVLKWFVYLTNWKMKFLMVDGSMEIKNSCCNPSAVIPSESYSLSTLELSSPQTVGSPDEGPINLAFPLLPNSTAEKSTFRRMLTLHMVLTADLLYVALDRTVDSSYLSIPFHSLDAIVLLTAYVYCNTPVLTHNKRKDFFVPMAVLYAYAFFYLIYQGVFHGTNQEGEPPYEVLNYHGDQITVIKTCIYSFALPIFMPLINRTVLEITEAVQLRVHEDLGDEEKATRRRDNYCLRFNNKLSSCCSGIFSYIRRHLPTFSSSSPQLG